MNESPSPRSLENEARLTGPSLGDVPTIDDAGQAAEKPRDVSPPPIPERLDRYRITALLGSGGFGRVYKGRDDELCRDVAIKVPLPERVARPGDVERCLQEARTLAALNHPNIVPVYDVGRTEDGLCFVVSRFIDGCDLNTRLARGRLPVAAAVELVAVVAEALHHAHRHGLVHRDVKPANILLDTDGKPYLADFGLALNQEDFDKGAQFLGTPSYMSPEQARREGHRVDGRSDIFSLGVVFYELLTGRLPFHGETLLQLVDQIKSVEARPPRQIDDRIPRELERICLKAVAKRASDRYTTALDLAEDLRHFLSADPATARPLPPAPTAAPPGPAPAKVMPKGLRSYDGSDADFFLDLLPGARDRDGLPESVRFWKNHIEQLDPDQTFAVGLLYGPSGCGKSSLVKAGLLPRLSREIVVVYVEATAEDTETRLLKALRKYCPELQNDLGLIESIGRLRQGSGTEGGRKVLLVLDQFEQFLHAKRTEASTELAEALRQCDGGRVQALLMVRDDFWLAVSRFMSDLEVEIHQGRNAALADLFDPLHARKVLAQFGVAFGRLPENPSERTPEQEAFLDQVVAGLTRDGKVISVRLSLFAEMVKGKPWARATLRDVGGTEGVGVTFLEETFSATTANPRHRLHQQAARAVLKALLPEQGTDIKGNMRPHAALLEASGYASRPKDFAELLSILDTDLRLITPTDPEGATAEHGTTPAPASGQFYQLTHDYLVPALRDWLTRKQRQTRRGRAELCLAERAAVWSTMPKTQFLPTFREWLSIRLLTRKPTWTEPQRKMMRQASRRYLFLSVRLVFLTTVLGVAAWGVLGWVEANMLAVSLENAPAAEAGEILDKLAKRPLWGEWMLRKVSVDGGHTYRLGALLRLRLDATQAVLCRDMILRQPPPINPAQKLLTQDLVSQIRKRPELLAAFWALLTDRAADPAQRYQAAGWILQSEQDQSKLVGVDEDTFHLLIAGGLSPELITKAVQQRGGFTYIKQQLARGDKALFPNFLPALSALGEARWREVESEVKRLFDEGAQARMPREKLSDLAGRYARLFLNRPRPASFRLDDEFLTQLRQAPDPTVRTALIANLGDWSQRISDRDLWALKDPTVLQAVLLGRGQRFQVVDTELQQYRTHPDPGVHAALAWMYEKRCRQVDEDLAGHVVPGCRWYVNREKQTFVILPAAGDIEVGSPADETRRSSNEPRRRARIDRPFALGMKHVSADEFVRFQPAPGRSPLPLRVLGEAAAAHSVPWAQFVQPATDVNWFDAMAYCRWLSDQEGIPEDQMCYPPVKEIRQHAKLPSGQRKGFPLPANFLERTGYRLPTEAEWEYACRAGSVTPWSHGLDETLVHNYARYAGFLSPRLLKPNAFGLFDMHGAAWQWCHACPEQMTEEDKQDPKRFIMLRGGSFRASAAECRSASRLWRDPYQGYDDVGFRVARTYRPPDP
jgi:serine/threonine protein kinase/formylglycine-generating enzyme required for sulfatase activity